MSKIIFPDGIIFDPPKNPLKEKWDKPNWSQVCDGYSCMWCDRCPQGDGWKVPEEDKEVYEQYKKEFDEYCNSHGGLLNATMSIKDILEEYINENI